MSELDLDCVCLPRLEFACPVTKLGLEQGPAEDLGTGLGWNQALLQVRSRDDNCEAELGIKPNHILELQDPEIEIS